MPENLHLNFDLQLYNPEAVQKAAYRVMNYLTADISVSENLIECKLFPNITVSKEQFSFGVEEFRKHVLDYQLRYNLKKETEQLRNLVLAVAFSKTDLLQSE